MQTHGEPVAWGADSAKTLGIDDVQGQHPTWGDATTIKEGEVPVYWGCGVSPQQAVMDAKMKGTFLSHQPGMMLVLDLMCEDLCE